MVFIAWITRIARGGRDFRSNTGDMLFKKKSKKAPPEVVEDLRLIRNGDVNGNLDNSETEPNDEQLSEPVEILATTSRNSTNDKSKLPCETFWSKIETKYNIYVHENARLLVLNEFQIFLKEEEKRKAEFDDKVEGYWDLLKKALWFLIHFFLVMLILFMGALAFVYLEDPEPVEILANTTRHSTNSALKLPSEVFWDSIEARYNLSFDEQAQLSLLNEFKIFSREEDERKAEFDANEKRKDRKFIFMKWFYFVTIVTTTIGYGDISPKTENGKYFYIFFSVVGIGLMMTLLKKCGTIISAANTKLYDLIGRILRRIQNEKRKMEGNEENKENKEDEDNKYISNEFLTFISISIIFAAYLTAGIYYGSQTDIDWTLVDVIYYWIVTFTTVGFGDILPPLENEIKNIYFYVVYRIFGLAFLAAIIDALSEYAKKRKEYFDKEQAKMKKKIQGKMPKIHMPNMPNAFVEGSV